MVKYPYFGNKKAIIPIFSYQYYGFFMVGGGGFEPPKSETTDLQSVAFGRSANLPIFLTIVVKMQ